MQNKFYKDTPYKIVDGIIATAFVLEKKHNNPKNIVCCLLPRDEFWSMNGIIIKEMSCLNICGAVQRLDTREWKP